MRLFHYLPLCMFKVGRFYVAGTPEFIVLHTQLHFKDLFHTALSDDSGQRLSLPRAKLTGWKRFGEAGANIARQPTRLKC